MHVCESCLAVQKYDRLFKAKVNGRDGCEFLWTFAFPRSLIFPSRSRVPVRHFFRVPLCSCVSVSHSYAPVSTSVCVGVGVQLMDGSGGPGQLATTQLPPLVTSVRCMSKSILAGSRFEVKLVSRPQSPPLPPLISSQKANLTFLFFQVLRKRETRNVGPSLVNGLLSVSRWKCHPST